MLREGVGAPTGQPAGTGGSVAGLVAIVMSAVSAVRYGKGPPPGITSAVAQSSFAGGTKLGVVPDELIALSSVAGAGCRASNESGSVEPCGAKRPGATPEPAIGAALSNAIVVAD